jgi:hypothetical protein
MRKCYTTVIYMKKNIKQRTITWKRYILNPPIHHKYKYKPTWREDIIQMTTTASWDVALCSIWWQKQMHPWNITLLRDYTPLHARKLVIFILTTVRTWNLINYTLWIFTSLSTKFTQWLIISVSCLSLFTDTLNGVCISIKLSSIKGLYFNGVMI